VLALQKPTAPAWAVNQLYWQRRRVYDRLVAAAEKLRARHAQRLTGHAADTASAEEAYAEALRAASDEVKALLEAAGEKASPDTLAAVRETLEALPAAVTPGRLSRPLKPMGFDALATLLGSGGKAGTRTAPREQAPQQKGPRARLAEDDRRLAERQAREQREAERRAAAERVRALGAARDEERRAASALARAKGQLKAKQQEHDRLSTHLERAAEDLDQLRRDVREREAAVRAAAAKIAAFSDV
jgi:hypothetical protein